MLYSCPHCDDFWSQAGIEKLAHNRNSYSFLTSQHKEHLMNLKVGSRKVKGVTVLDLSGRLVLGEETRTLRETLKELAVRGEKKILLNLADVSYVDSTGLGTLVSGYATLSGQQGQLKLLNLTKKIRDILQMTKLLTVFESFDDEAKAIESFR
jgi:anti-sigma B factor antagonist